MAMESEQKDSEIASLKAKEGSASGEDVESLKKQLEDAENENEELAMSMAEKENELEGVKTQLEELKKQLEEAEEQNEEMAISMGDQESALEDLKAKLEKATATAEKEAEEEAEEKATAAELKEKEEEIVGLKGEIRVLEKAKAENASLRRSLEEMKARYEEALTEGVVKSQRLAAFEKSEEARPRVVQLPPAAQALPLVASVEVTPEVVRPQVVTFEEVKPEVARPEVMAEVARPEVMAEVKPEVKTEVKTEVKAEVTPIEVKVDEKLPTLEVALERIAAQLEKWQYEHDITRRYAINATDVTRAMGASTLVIVQRNLTLLSNRSAGMAE